MMATVNDMLAEIRGHYSKITPEPDQALTYLKQVLAPEFISIQSESPYLEKEKEIILNLPANRMLIDYPSLFASKTYTKDDINLLIEIEDSILRLVDAYLGINPYRKEFASAKFLQHIKARLLAPILEVQPEWMVAFGLASDIEEAKTKGQGHYPTAYYDSLER